jgi:hypothetical protein
MSFNFENWFAGLIFAQPVTGEPSPEIHEAVDLWLKRNAIVSLQSLRMVNINILPTEWVLGTKLHLLGAIMDLTSIELGE